MDSAVTETKPEKLQKRVRRLQEAQGQVRRYQAHVWAVYVTGAQVSITKDVVNALQMRIDSLEKELSDLKMDKGEGSKEGTATPPLVADAFAGGLAFNSHGELRFYGPTSSYRAILADVTESSVEAARAWSLTRAPVPYAPPLDPQLPRRPPVLSSDFSAKLIGLAFEHAFSQFGLVDERSFLQDLTTSATRRTPHYSPLLLHLVLAFGARYLDPADTSWPREICSDPADPSTRGDVFVEWARLAIDGEYRHPDVSTVMSLTCLSVYLGGMACDGPALMFHAQSMALAEDFGLHLDNHHLQIGSRTIPPALRDVRRKAFWAAFQVDVLNSIYIGRRPHWFQDDIDVPNPPIDNDVEFDPPAYRSSSSHAASKLMQITARLLATVYSLKPGVQLAARQSALPELHLALEQCFFRRTNEETMLSVSTEKCLSSSKHIVRLVRLQRERYGLRFTAPLFQHCCFTAGTILALSANEDHILGVPQRDLERKTQAATDLKTIIAALRSISDTWKTATTSANVLEAFMSQWSKSGVRSAGPGSATPNWPVRAGVPQQAAPDALAAALAAHNAQVQDAGAGRDMYGFGGQPLPAEEQAAWQDFTADLTATDLDVGGSLDDFMNLLGPSGATNSLDFDPLGFAAQAAAGGAD
ncbi:C6 transcription factor [Rhodotorula toruloides]|uniref:C6 transcription factor n=1 Tax=Rhodotorula toruloides TaxID=5286 RepID=A0A511KED3_RHOTO|nr:C6 transcription factor [Rhodotorula toruloides]